MELLLAALQVQMLMLVLVLDHLKPFLVVLKLVTILGPIKREFVLDLHKQVPVVLRPVVFLGPVRQVLVLELQQLNLVVFKLILGPFKLVLLL